MSLRLGLVLSVIMALLASPLFAHQQKEAITQVLFNQRTGNIEVMHRFLLHDAEHAVQMLRHGKADLVGSADDREFFAAYVHTRFSITDQDGRVLPLSAVGQEIEGRFLWVYAETGIPPDIESITLRHDALRDIWVEQVNLVNVEYDGEVRSVSFMGGATELTVSFN